MLREIDQANKKSEEYNHEEQHQHCHLRIIRGGHMKQQLARLAVSPRNKRDEYSSSR